MSFNDWIVGYSKSFTMALHRGFIVSTHYRLLYSNKCKHNVSIFVAAGTLLVSLMKIIRYNSNDNDSIPFVSLMLIIGDLLIEIIVYIIYIVLISIVAQILKHL